MRVLGEDSREPWCHLYLFDSDRPIYCRPAVQSWSTLSREAMSCRHSLVLSWIAGRGHLLCTLVQVDLASARTRRNNNENTCISRILEI
jgi:hypothetical protein